MRTTIGGLACAVMICAVASGCAGSEEVLREGWKTISFAEGFSLDVPATLNPVAGQGIDSDAALLSGPGLSVLAAHGAELGLPSDPGEVESIDVNGRRGSLWKGPLRGADDVDYGLVGHFEDSATSNSVLITVTCLHGRPCEDGMRSLKSLKFPASFSTDD